jgi:tryptophan-rich sensory protein
MRRRVKKWLGFAGWTLLPFMAAIFGAGPSSAAFYATLVKPGWAPPPSVFGPVWFVLYLMMGISAALVWQRQGFERARGALMLFLTQLGVNAIWSPVFFGQHQVGLALGVIVALDLLVLATILAFARKHAVAAWLLAPYLAWIAFATALNFAIWRLN